MTLTVPVPQEEAARPGGGDVCSDSDPSLSLRRRRHGRAAVTSALTLTVPVPQEEAARPGGGDLCSDSVRPCPSGGGGTAGRRARR